MTMRAQDRDDLIDWMQYPKITVIDWGMEASGYLTPASCRLLLIELERHGYRIEQREAVVRPPSRSGSMIEREREFFTDFMYHGGDDADIIRHPDGSLTIETQAEYGDTEMGWGSASATITMTAEQVEAFQIFLTRGEQARHRSHEDNKKTPPAPKGGGQGGR